MPPTEAPPNPPQAAPPPPSEQLPIKVQTRRFGELDHTELVHLLDSLEGDQAKSRFRESIYISVIVYLIIAWFIVYGPKYVFHTGRIVPTAKEMAEKQRLTEMELNRDLSKELAKPKVPKIVPKVDRKVMDQLKTIQRAQEIARATPPAPAPPQPTPAPAPTPAPSTPAPVQALPSAPTPQPAPRPAPTAAIPDAPAAPGPPAPTSNLAQSMKNATSGLHPGGHMEGNGGGTRVGPKGGATAGAGYEILSDTGGVDLTDYINRLLRMLKAAWYPLIPEECYPPISKEGKTLIKFTIAKNGALLPPPKMTLDGRSGDVAIDKAAWGSIVSIGQFPPLPAGVPEDLQLRITFIISRTGSDTN